MGFTEQRAVSVARSVKKEGLEICVQCIALRDDTTLSPSSQEFARRSFPPSLPHKLQLLRGPGSSNVILRDFCLQGPHPGSSKQEIIAALTPLLRAGVTTFVCLQPELPVLGAAHPGLRRDPTRTVAATGACRMSAALCLAISAAAGARWLSLVPLCHQAP